MKHTEIGFLRLRMMKYRQKYQYDMIANQSDPTTYFEALIGVHVSATYGEY
jgi:hypothetical protein